MAHLKIKKGKKQKRADLADPLAHREDEPTYQPEGAEKDLLQELRTMLSRAVGNKSQVQEMMKDGEEIYQSGSLNDEIPEVMGIDQEVTTNFGKALIKSVQSRVTDQNPRPIAVKRNPDDQLFAEIMDDTMQWVLDVNDWKWVRDKAIVDCTNKGVSFARVIWDPSLSKDKGNIRISHINPLRVFPGSHTDNLQDQEQIHIVHSDPVSKVIDKMKRLNEGVDKERSRTVTADEELEEKIADAAGERPFTQFNSESLADMLDVGSRQGPIHRMKNKKEGITSSGPDGDFAPNDNVNYFETYIRYPEGHDLHDTYPKGRLIYWTKNGILGDFAWQKDNWPLVKFELEPTSDYFFNEPVIMPIASIQRAINALSNLILKASTVHAFPPFLTTSNSGIKRDEFENVGPANRVLYTTPEALQAGAGWMQPPPIPKAAFELRQNLIQEAEQIMGVHDVTQGRTPGSIQSGSAFARLQEADNQGLRMKIRQFNKGLKRMGEIIVENIQEHMDQQRFIHVGDGPAERSIRLNQNVSVQRAKALLQNRSDRDDERAREIIQRAIQRTQQEQNIKDAASGKIKLDPTLASVDLRIGGGTDTKLSQVAKAQDAIRLFEMGVIDNRALLEAMDWDDIERVIRKKDREGILARQVESLQERLNETESTLNEIINTADKDARESIRSALNNLNARRSQRNGQG